MLRTRRFQACRESCGEIETRRARYGIPKLLLDAALLKPSPDGRSYRKRIDALKTEREMNTLYQDMISELPLRANPSGEPQSGTTGGPMQVSVAFAEAMHGCAVIPIRYPTASAARSSPDAAACTSAQRSCSTIRHPTPNRSTVSPTSMPAATAAAMPRSSGRYRRLSREHLALDGDLLRYRDGRPADQASDTQNAFIDWRRSSGCRAPK